MMVVCWKMSIDVIFDIIEYGGLLADRIKKGLSKSFRYQKVGTAWRGGGINVTYTCKDGVWICGY